MEMENSLRLLTLGEKTWLIQFSVIQLSIVKYGFIVRAISHLVYKESLLGWHQMVKCISEKRPI